MARSRHSLDGTLAALESGGFRTIEALETDAGTIARTTFGPAGTFVFEPVENQGTIRADQIESAIMRARTKADALGERLARGGARVRVTPVVVLTGGRLRGREPDGVRVVGVDEIETVVCSARVLEYHEIARCLSMIATDLSQRRHAVAWA